jgi:hypothetical protein
MTQCKLLLFDAFSVHPLSAARSLNAQLSWQFSNMTSPLKALACQFFSSMTDDHFLLIWCSSGLGMHSFVVLALAASNSLQLQFLLSFVPYDLDQSLSGCIYLMKAWLWLFLLGTTSCCSENLCQLINVLFGARCSDDLVL